MNETPANFPMYVDADGQYGPAEDLIQFKYGDLTQEQWDNVAELDGYDRLRYVQAVLDNDPLEQAYILGEDL